jgi:hypothetical protein
MKDLPSGNLTVTLLRSQDRMSQMALECNCSSFPPQSTNGEVLFRTAMMSCQGGEA